MTEEREVCVTFSNYFSNAATKVIEDNFSNTSMGNCTKSKDNLNSFIYFPVNAENIEKVIKNLKNTNAVGLDCIPIRIVKGM